MIAHCGVLDHTNCRYDAELRREVERCYRAYRRNYWPEIWAKLFSFGRHRTKSPAARADHPDQERFLKDVRIAFIGVWDTVDAVGFPSDYLADFVNKFIYRFKFPEHKLSDKVDCARHALAIDEERKTFHPLLWEENPERPANITQVWFPGVHSNIGGGYPKQGMSLVALDSLMAEAEAVGLRFVPTLRQDVFDRKNPNDRLYDSRAGLGCYYRYGPRDIGAICHKALTVPKTHLSTLERLIQGTEGYAPGNIPVGAQLVATGVPQAALIDLNNTLQHIFTDAQPSLESARKHNRPFMVARHYGQTVMLVASMLTVYQTVVTPPVREGALMAMLKLVSANGALAIGKTLLHSPLLLGLLVVPYCTSWFAKYRMEKRNSEYWYSHIPVLKKAFAQTAWGHADKKVVGLFRNLF